MLRLLHILGAVMFLGGMMATRKKMNDRLSEIRQQNAKLKKKALWGQSLWTPSITRRLAKGVSP